MVNPSTGRASLLESIRQAGGIGKANLRSVKERKLEKKKQKEQEQGAEALWQNCFSLPRLGRCGSGGRQAQQEHSELTGQKGVVSPHRLMPVSGVHHSARAL